MKYSLEDLTYVIDDLKSKLYDQYIEDYYFGDFIFKYSHINLKDFINDYLELIIAKNISDNTANKVQFKLLSVQNLLYFALAKKQNKYLTQEFRVFFNNYKIYDNNGRPVNFLLSENCMQTFKKLCRENIDYITDYTCNILLNYQKIFFSEVSQYLYSIIIDEDAIAKENALLSTYAEILSYYFSNNNDLEE